MRDLRENVRLKDEELSSILNSAGANGTLYLIINRGEMRRDNIPSQKWNQRKE